MKYSEKIKNGFRLALAKTRANHRLLAVIHEGKILYRSDWEKSNGRYAFELRFRIRFCPDDPKQNKTYELDLNSVSLLGSELVGPIAHMVLTNLDFTADNPPDWSLSRYAERLNQILRNEVSKSLKPE